MKLHVTKAELLALLTKALGETVEDVVIAKGNSNLYKKVIDAFKTDGSLNCVGGIVPDKKIQAIKLLRGNVYPRKSDGNILGLAPAKWAIEHWDEFTAFIKRNRRFPEIAGDYPNHDLK